MFLPAIFSLQMLRTLNNVYIYLSEKKKHKEATDSEISVQSEISIKALESDDEVDELLNVKMKK